MRIMFIDDEARRMRVYVEELTEAGHEVIFRDSVDSALETLRDESERFDLAVVDISMPTGAEYRFEDTDGGSRTGLALYDTIRREWPALKVLVFTNVYDPRLAERFAREDPKVCMFARKPDILPFQLLELVEEFGSGHSDGADL
jgi:CheY-like chemotaxis protein